MHIHSAALQAVKSSAHVRGDTPTVLSLILVCFLLLLLSHFSRVRLCNRIDSSPPGSVIPGILQARTVEWVAISFSNAWKWKVKVKSLSCFWLFKTPWTAAYQVPPSMGFARQAYWSGVPLPSPNIIATLYFYIVFKFTCKLKQWL